MPALGALVSAAAPTPAVAQDDTAPLYLTVDSADGALHIRVGDLFEDGGLTRALQSGLPLRIRVVAELWKDGFFDRQRGRFDWRVSVVFDPLSRQYRIATGTDGAVERPAASLDAVREELQRAFVVPLRPPEPGRYYYLGKVEVETLSLSDLEELSRWLKGDLAPAVAGEREVNDAVGKGVRRLFVRMLGLPAKRFRVRTPTFEVPPDGER